MSTFRFPSLGQSKLLSFSNLCVENRGKRRAPLVFIFCLAAMLIGTPCTTAFAQSGEWVWQEGSNTGVQAGSYGSLGVAAATNYPPARLSPIEWTDASGKLWLFGGYDTTKNHNRYNDLWVFDPSTTYWTWVGGSQTPNQPGVYGTLGTAAAGNIPGARYGSAVWVDSSGKVWLFGGDAQYESSGNDDLYSDLWTFDPTTQLWTCMAGDNTLDNDANWGTMGSANSNNSPGGRMAAGTWVDSSGTFWMFGGLNWWSIWPGSADMNDLWSFNPKTLQWTWVSGTNTPYATPAMNVAQGVADANNFPGAMDSMSTWIDKSGNLYLFGGYGWDQYEDAEALDDLWEYSPTTNQWTWLNGDESVGMPGIYGPQGTPGSGYHPGGHDYAASWTDYAGNFWLFGGNGVDSNGKEGYINDLWEYSPAAGTWTWMAGSETRFAQTNYGSEGVAASTNDPGNRAFTGYWKDNNGNFWLFGGISQIGIWPNNKNVVVNDLWEYQFTAAAVPVFNPAGGNYAYDQTVTISDSTPGATIYYTTDGTKPTTNSTVYSSTISVTAPETIQAIAAAPGYSSSPVASAAYTFTRPDAATPLISPASGNYIGTVSVTITDSTPNAVIYYTTDGSTPTASSSVYGGAFSVTPPATVKAIAVATNYSSSVVAIAAYTRPTVATPVISPTSGTYTGDISVSITDTTSASVIYYTIDGTTPTASSNLYTGPFNVSLSGTVSAVALASGYNDSGTATATYNIVQLTPTLTGISPLYIPDGTAFMLTVNGTNFIPGSIIYWGVNALTTQYGSATQLTAQVPASLASSGNAASQSYMLYAITVRTPGALSVSNAGSFLVVSPNYASMPITITPATATVAAGSSASFAISTTTGNTLSAVTPLNMPSGMTYLFVPGVTSSPGQGTSSYGTVTFTTTSATPKGTYVITILCTGTFPKTVQSASLLPILLLPLLFLRKKLMARNVWLQLCVGMVLLASALAMVGCAAQGNYKLQPTTASGYATNATTVTITVQ